MASLADINIRFSADLRGFSQEMQNVTRDMKKIGGQLSQAGNTLSLGITLPVLAAGAAAVNMASDYEESLNKVNVAFGNSAASVQNFSKTTLDTFGIAESTALDMAALFGDMATSMGLPQAEAANLSTSLVGLAGDLASFKNIGIDQAVTALNGVFTGETESLKLLGIVMTEQNLAQFALSQGIQKNIKDFTQAEKVQLRYAFIMDKTKNAQGDFARTSGGAANQTRTLTERFKEIGQQLGAIILPAWNRLLTAVNSLLKGFQQLSPGAKQTIVVFAGVAAAIGPLLVAGGAILTLIPSMIAGFTALKAAVASFTATIAANPFGAIAVAVSAVVAGLVLWNGAQKKVLTSQEALNKALVDGTKNAVNEVSNLDRLFKAATDVNASLKDRKAAVEELQKIYPAYFKNIDIENIKNSQSISVYKELRQAIFDKAKAAAIEIELQRRAEERLLTELSLRENIAKTEAEIKRIKAGANTIVLQEASALEKTNRVTVTKAELLDAQIKLLQRQRNELQNFTNASLKSDEILINSKTELDANSAKLTQNEIERQKLLGNAVSASINKQVKEREKLQASNLSGANGFNTIADYRAQISIYEELRDNSATTAAQINLLDEAIKNLETQIQIKFDTSSLIQAPVLMQRVTTAADALKQKGQELATNLNEAFKQIARSAIENLAVGFGQAIAQMVQGANGADVIGALLLNTIGDLMVQLGQAAIQIGVAMLAIKNAFTNPALPIALGIGLVAAGTLIKSAIPNDFQKFADGGIVGGNSFYGDKILARVNSGELILNQKQQRSLAGMLAVPSAQNVNLGVNDVVIDGTKLRIILDRVDEANKRKK